MKDPDASLENEIWYVLNDSKEWRLFFCTEAFGVRDDFIDIKMYEGFKNFTQSLIDLLTTSVEMVITLHHAKLPNFNPISVSKGMEKKLISITLKRNVAIDLWNTPLESINC